MASDSRGIDDTCVLQIDSTMDPCSRTWRRAISVSIVSPDCDIATTSVRGGWGWAFTSEGAPFVAQLVCPVAAVAGGIGLRSTLSTRLASLPAFLRTTACPMPEATSATPAESYPRYSRRCNP